jgi:hypothetical protein
LFSHDFVLSTHTGTVALVYCCTPGQYGGPTIIDYADDYPNDPNGLRSSLVEKTSNIIFRNIIFHNEDMGRPKQLLVIVAKMHSPFQFWK